MQSDPQSTRRNGAAEAVGLLGATSFVGQLLISRLTDAGRRVSAFSRSAAVGPTAAIRAGVRWQSLLPGEAVAGEPLPCWIAACPLWAISDHFPLLEARGVRQLVALSSTSRFTKLHSANSTERAVAARLAAAEETVARWAAAAGVTATVLRPTMIYDGIHDQNIAAIARFIRRWGFFPVVGQAAGLRQPVHADDVAAACLAALTFPGLRAAYDLSGGETLSYRDMVQRIFAWLSRPSRLVTVPPAVFRAAAPLVSRLPGLHALPAMAERMNRDLVFDHVAAEQDLGFQPRPFTLPLGRDPKHAGGISLSGSHSRGAPGSRTA